VITPEPSNEFPWISIWRLVKQHPQYFVYILEARWIRPAFAESYRLWRVILSKELVAVHVWNAPGQWHNWRVTRVRATTTPVKLNVKSWPLPSLYFGIYYSFGSVDCCFFAFFGVFSGEFGFLCRCSIPDFLLFLNYFLNVSQWPLFS